MNWQTEMRSHPSADDLRRKRIRCFGRKKNSLHTSRSRSPQESAEIARVTDLVGDEDKIRVIGNW